MSMEPEASEMMRMEVVPLSDRVMRCRISTGEVEFFIFAGVFVFKISVVTMYRSTKGVT